MKKLLHEFLYGLFLPFSFFFGSPPEGATENISWRYVLGIFVLAAIVVFGVWFMSSVLHWF